MRNLTKFEMKAVSGGNLESTATWIDSKQILKGVRINQDQKLEMYDHAYGKDIIYTLNQSVQIDEIDL